jgi:hypothetical protein
LRKKEKGPEKILKKEFDFQLTLVDSVSVKDDTGGSQEEGAWIAQALAGRTSRSRSSSDHIDL